MTSTNTAHPDLPRTCRLPIVAAPTTAWHDDISNSVLQAFPTAKGYQRMGRVHTILCRDLRLKLCGKLSTDPRAELERLRGYTVWHRGVVVRDNVETALVTVEHESMEILLRRAYGHEDPPVHYEQVAGHRPSLRRSLRQATRNAGDEPIAVAIVQDEPGLRYAVCGLRSFTKILSAWAQRN